MVGQRSVEEAPVGQVRRALRWLRVVFAVLCIAAGALVTVDPFVSVVGLAAFVALGLVLTGAVELARAADTPSVVAGAGWLVAGVAVAVWPGLTVRVLAIVVGVALVAGGAVEAAGAGRRVTGTASVVLGVVALAWPAPTVAVVGAVFGVHLLLFGIAELAGTLQYRPRAAVAGAIAVALLAVGGWLHDAHPRPDAFYTPPVVVPATPGVLLRSEPSPHAAPPGARAWRILYTTTRDEHTPAVASAVVLVATRVPAGPRPVLAWAHGATGITPDCAPSLLSDPLGGGAMPGLDQVLADGWVVVATDYPGLGTPGPHPFLIGQGEARSVLDAVRAAHHLSGVTLADRTVVWGHSQGGNAALWAGILAPTYAPEAGVIGVAALAPGSELSPLVQEWGRVKQDIVFAAYVAQAYSDTYPDVRFTDYIRPAARIPVHELAGRCLADSKLYLSGLASLLLGQPVWAADPTTGALGTRLRQNTPTGPIPVPVLVAQGGADTVVLPTAQADFVNQRCTGGGTLEYRTYPGRDHVGLIAPGSPMIPDLLRWTQDRLDDRPAPSTCPA
jgi:uncharacterized membrane protein HdeD (DUF308 family)